MVKSTNPSIKTVVIIPNWDGITDLPACIDSLLAQSEPHHLIIVDNGSVDGSVELIEKCYPQVELIKHDHNKGYAGGVNPGFKRAIELGATYAAPFNNDAVADKDWLKNLVISLDADSRIGIAACKVATADGSQLDSTGDFYTHWGLAYPRGRGEADTGQYDDKREIFAASGAASLYRVATLEQVGLLDEDFFAYYEDVDLSFRARLAGWDIRYVPSSVVYHEQGTTSRRITGFTVYMTIKNYPWLLIKNVPRSLLPRIVPRFLLAYLMFVGKALTTHNIKATGKGLFVCLARLPKKLGERHNIQQKRVLSDDGLWNLLTHDLPPNAHKLRSLRSLYQRLALGGRK